MKKPVLFFSALLLALSLFSIPSTQAQAPGECVQFGTRLDGVLLWAGDCIASGATATATANAGSANGWFLAAKPSSVAGDDIYAFANFDDLTQLTINSGDVVRVTPKLRFHISAQA